MRHTDQRDIELARVAFDQGPEKCRYISPVETLQHHLVIGRNCVGHIETLALVSTPVERDLESSDSSVKSHLAKNSFASTPKGMTAGSREVRVGGMTSSIGHEES